MIAAAPSALTAESGAGRLTRLIVIGTIPAIIVGVLLADWLEANLRTPAVIAVTLTIGALMLLASGTAAARRRDEQSLALATRLLIGIAQASALVPGMSRSGSTIAVGDAARDHARVGRALLVSARHSGDRRGGGEGVASSCATCTLTRRPLTLFAVGMLSRRSSAT